MHQVERYLLLDGNSLAFRAWFALQDAQMENSSGQQTQAVFGFVSMVAKLLEDQEPTGMAVAFDRHEPTFRDALVADYKGGRPPTPEPLIEQIELIRRFVETLGIPACDAVGFEADDVIATLATRLESEGHEVIVVTGDRDCYQLVHDPLVRVLYNRRGVTDYVLYDEAGIEERTGVRPALYPLLASLRGDPSDNLPGVPGVGEKTAAKLVNAYGDVDTLYDHLGELTPKLRSSLAEHEAQVRSNLRMSPLVRDVPLECTTDDLALGREDREALSSLFDRLEMRGPRDRVLKQLDRLASARGGGAVADRGGRTGTATGGDGPGHGASLSIVALTDASDAAAWLSQVAAGEGPVAVEPAYAGAPGRSAIEGLAINPAPPDVPRGPGGADDDRAAVVGWLEGALLGEAEVADALRDLLERRADGRLRIVAHRAKELMRSLDPLGVVFDGLDLDTAVASYLFDARAGQATVAELSAKATGAEAGGEQLGFGFSDEPEGDGGGVSLLAHATAARAAALAAIAPSLWRALDDGGVRALYDDVERPLIRVLAKMELAGIAVDVDRLRAINVELTADAMRLEAEIHDLAGEPFNVNSTPQLRHILFEKLQLAPSKRTKTGYSTDAQSLEKLRDAHPIVECLLRYREVEKLRSTYGEGLLAEVAPDGRIHASFNQTVARTGRLSSDQPNLHNIPVRSPLGLRFREAFIPRSGARLLLADYDQIELRVIAHLSGDPGLVESFRSGVDIHNATAARVFGVKPEEVTLAMRSKAKMISYGLAYGMEAYGLSQRLGVPVEEAGEILNQYFTAFPNVKRYMERSVADARARGYTETLLGRRRYLPELDSSNFRVRQAAERQAMNSGIQGLAADIFKVALV